MTRLARVIAAAVALQAALLGVYWLVERGRTSTVGPDAALSTAPGVEVQGRLPALTARRRDGTLIELDALPRTTLVHFWATWCPPCRVELPALLRASEEGSVDVLLVALDPDWAAVERFMGGATPDGVVLGDAARVEAALGVRALPVTLLVAPKGQLRLRFEGARDWGDARLRRSWRGPG